MIGGVMRVFAGILAYIMLLASVFFLSGCATLENRAGEDGPDYLELANFDSMLEVNDFDGSLFGYWNGFPEDITQKCEFTFFDPGRDGNGSSLKIIYNVDSPRVAYNGFWMLFKALDFKSYSKLTFWAKTESRRVSPGNFKMELKNENKKAIAKVFNGLDTEWQKFEIDFTENAFMQDWKSITEFVIVFEKDEVDHKRGILFIDDIALER